MHTILLAYLDINPPMSDRLIQQISAIPAHEKWLDVSCGPDPRFPTWPRPTTARVVGSIHQHRPARLIYAGQHWNHCVWYSAAGIYWMQRFRPWCEILIRPDLIRTKPAGNGPSRPDDRTLTPQDLGPEWQEQEAGWYRLDPEYAWPPVTHRQPWWPR